MPSSSSRLVDRFLSVYTYFKTFPIVKRARVVSALTGTDLNKLSLEVEWEQSDVSRTEIMRYIQHYYLTSTEHESPIATNLDYASEPELISLGNGFPFPADNGTRLVWDIRSPPSPTMRAICLEYTQSPNVFKASSSTKACSPTVGTFVQIWSSGRLLKTIMLPTHKPTLVHGKVYADAGGTFIGAAWSSDSKKIVYLAEALRAEGSESNESTSVNSMFRYQDNWGEGLCDVSQTVLCMLNVSDGTSNCVVSPDNLPDVAPTKPVWCPTDSGIVFLGYALEAYRLGLKYCTQRPCRLYHLDFATGKIRSVSNAHKSADCPRFSPDGKHLIWLENDIGGPHQQCRALMELRWPWDGQTMPTVIVPVIEKPKDSSGFPGLYCELPERCWTSDSSCVVLSSIWGFHLAPLIIPITRQSIDETFVYRIPGPPEIESTVNLQTTSNSVTVLDVYCNVVIVSASTLLHPPFVSVLHLPEHAAETNWPTWLNDCRWLSIPPGLPNMGMQMPHVTGSACYILPVESTADAHHNCTESLLIQPLTDSSGKPQSVTVSDSRLTDFNEWLPLVHCSSIHGLIVYPHGGPHSAFTANWSPLVVGLVACGFACLLINYRGSLGYGEMAVRSLLGKIAQNDVDDCFQATTCALKKLEKDYGRKLPAVLFGGSHGGFLVLHLAARYPNLFRAVVARNPVTNLISMLDTSDIPDWDYVEAGFNVDNAWSLGSIPSDSCLSTMASMSPLFRLDSTWTVPLLLLLGDKDCRVPKSQGLTFYRRLRALNPQVDCETFVYPHDAHPLDSPAADRDVFVRALQWFYTHLNLDE
ncbi:Acylamino-acid-releasing enzyme [Paragonimus heterotremus]|uniref:Acylamino-acid-releasing enzyme n=1 Tax=Paragonimus heterotremus TaxID=100268 RepID=A0A8J4SR03_9TREM|nr:Acylamino-acid-releasing enzyme [Paragonimus heterotremus]